MFIAKQAEATFDQFFPIIVYEWREQEGAWNMKEQQAFQAAHKCFAQNITIDKASYMYAASILLLYNLMYNYFCRSCPTCLDAGHELEWGSFPGYLKETCTKTIKLGKAMQINLQDLASLFEKGR